ncbi:hypothetical protein [Corynebacterium glutamicum]|uniref:hypothetical protein n=1 Tax=Corynebacterium glutamicum TaxID=1718 RepID=UPI0005C77312|nr:hypothetical protein [Corynebacterium glutamicum]
MQCPTPQKKRFPTWMDAQAELSRALQTGRQRKLPQRIYKCPCGRFHLTSKPMGQQVVKTPPPPAPEPEEHTDTIDCAVVRHYGRWRIKLDGIMSIESFKTKKAAEAHYQKVLEFREKLARSAKPENRSVMPEKWGDFGYE